MGATFTGGATLKGGLTAASYSPTGPTISSISSAPTTTQCTITWTTDQAATTQVCRGVTGGPYNTCTTLDSSLVTSHSAVFTGLSASTQYFYVVKSTNLPGTTTTCNSGGTPLCPSGTELTFTTSAAGCGPPTYPCGSRSTATVTEGNWSNVAPAINDIFTDGTYGTTLVKVADSTLCTQSGNTYVPTSLPSMEASLWDKDGAYFTQPFRNNGGSVTYLARAFNTTTHQASAVTGTGTGLCRTSGSSGGLELRGTGRFGNNAPFFSPDESAIVYGQTNADARVVGKIDLSAGTGTVTTVKDPNDSDCMNGNFTGTPEDVAVIGSGSSRMYVITSIFSGDTGGGQDTWTTVLAIHATLGCRWYRTNSGQGAVYNATGSGWDSGGYPTGAVSTAATFKMHNVRAGTHPTIIELTAANGTCAGLSNCWRFFWDIPTLNVYNLQQDSTNKGGNHGSLCYGYANNVTLSWSSAGQFGQWSRDVTNEAGVTQRITTGSPTIANIEGYSGCQNGLSDNSEYFASEWHRDDGDNLSNGPLVGKFVMVKTTGALDYSIQFNLCNGQPSSAFSNEAPRAYISKDGKFALWATSGTLCGSSGKHSIVAVLQ